MKQLFISLILLFFTFSLNAQTSVLGDWKGAIEVQGQQLVVIFHIEGEPENYAGTLDIPQQGAKGLALTRADQKGDSVFFAFAAGQVTGSFDGELKQDSLISGMYKQGPASFPFQIKKQKQNSSAKDEPGKGIDLIIPNGDVEIGGTLVLPDEAAEAPLVILISGSGAQNRDSNIFEFRPFALIADHLKANGIASFRYDDRQIGKSTGSFSDATLDILASDVNAIIQYFTDSKEYNVGKIILLGHSQGGVVAGKVANENEKTDQLILMASTGISLKDVLRFQVDQAYGEGIHPKEEIEKEIKLRENLMAVIRDREGVEEAKEAYIRQYKKMLNALPEAQKAGLGDIDAFAKRQVSQLAAIYSAPQTQSLLFYDPAEDLDELEIPVLVLFGEKDTQVTENLNREPIEMALKKAGTVYKIVTIPKANHLFQEANTGMATEYAMLEKQFTDDFLKTISMWIKSH